ncbi:hypothetical protein [Ottowia sp. VDI28]|uniref:hypothetical protein n=1 Tax=Ottowia sp. VDI28 TaxID=3133968 RepID=UPI003C2E08BA
MKTTLRSALRLFSITSIFLTLSACALGPTHHVFIYQGYDNPDVDLLEWEYSGYSRGRTFSLPNGITQISHGVNLLGKDLKIKWRDNFTQKTYQTDIPLSGKLPFNMHNAEIRLIFNEFNQPEVYAIHESPGAKKYFKFKGGVYTNKLVKQVYPIEQEIKIE